MIWIPETVQSESALCSYISSYLLEQGILGGDIDAHCVEALSHAMAEYLELSSDRAGFFVEDGNLLLLASQALRAVGQSEAATKVLMLGRGFVRPVSCLVTTSEKGWTLDVARIAREGSGLLEITFFRCLHATIEMIAQEWIAYQGNVVLKLQGCEAAGAIVLNRSARSREVLAFADEIMQAAKERIASLADAYNWSEIPQVIRHSIKTDLR